MARRSVSRMALAIGRPQAAQSPYQPGEGFQPRAWFRFDNSVNGEDTTHLYIYDMIGGWFGVTADEMISQLKNITTPSITLHINSPGGDVFDAVAIYNALRFHPANIDVQVDSLAASAASFIAQAGDTVTMNRGSMMMIHDASAMSYENADGHRETGSILDKISNNVAGIYADRAGETEAIWRETMKSEAWYTAQEAVDAGLADKVGDKEAAVDPKNVWNLSIFNYAGRPNAPSPFEVMNRAKEATMSGEGAGKKDDKSETGTPAGAPEAPKADEGASASGSPEGEAGTKTEAESKVNPSNLVVNTPILCNGVSFTNVADIQAHIAKLETYFTDTQKAGRQSFVQGLASDNKISAAKIDALTAFALSLDDKAYDAWMATWDGAPKSALFESHGGGGEHSQGDPTAQTAIEKKVETAKSIVASFRRSNMTQAQIEKTEAYQVLVANNAL